MGWIKDRIDSEYRKHNKLDWSRIAESKISNSFRRMIDRLENELRKRNEDNKYTGINVAFITNSFEKLRKKLNGELKIISP